MSRTREYNAHLQKPEFYLQLHLDSRKKFNYFGIKNAGYGAGFVEDNYT
jgi:hypothetical protein